METDTPGAMETDTPGETPGARCAVMSVVYLPRMADTVPPEARGIEIVIPGEAVDAVKLWIEIRSQPTPSPALLESLASAIASHLARNNYGLPVALHARPGLAPAKLQRVLAFIEQHLAEPIRIERLAAAVHMSPFHFARLFKLATGQAPHGFLTRRRIERAKELLSKETLPLVHVASSVGFQTQGHFTEVFRRHAGMTPRHFRLHWRLSSHG